MIFAQTFVIHLKLQNICGRPFEACCASLRSLDLDKCGMVPLAGTVPTPTMTRVKSKEIGVP